jgi:uncharacterized protein
MEFEWDPQKNELNIQKHGFSFEDACQVLIAPHYLFPSERNNETRWGAIGLLNGLYVVVFFTMRDQRYRIISMRRARNYEEEKYRQLYS